MELLHHGKLLKNCSLWEELRLDKLMEDCLLYEGPHAGAGEGVRNSPPEEEGAAERMCSKLLMLIPRIPAPLSGRRWKNREWS